MIKIQSRESRSNSRKSLSRQNLAGFLFASPWIIGFLIFFLYPVLTSAFYSFTSFSVFKKPVWVGLANYTNLFSDELFLKSVYNTLYFAVIYVPLSIIFGLFLAMLLNLDIKGQSLFRTIFYLPSIVPVVASSILWLWLLNYEYGLINSIIRIFGIDGPLWLGDAPWTKPAMILMSIWGVGNIYIIFLAALKEVPKTYYEAAEIDGCSAFQRFWRITIPCISNVIFYQIIIGIIGGLQYFTQAYVMLSSHLQSANGGPENSMLFYSLNLFHNAFIFLKMGYASAMAWILFLVTALITLILFKSSAKWVFYGGDEN